MRGATQQQTLKLACRSPAESPPASTARAAPNTRSLFFFLQSAAVRTLRTARTRLIILDIPFALRCIFSALMACCSSYSQVPRDPQALPSPSPSPKPRPKRGPAQ